MVPKLYFFPWITKPVLDSEYTAQAENFSDSTFQFVISFDILPVVMIATILKQKHLIKNFLFCISPIVPMFVLSESLYSSFDSLEQMVMESRLGSKAGNVQLKRTYCGRLRSWHNPQNKSPPRAYLPNNCQNLWRNTKRSNWKSFYRPGSKCLCQGNIFEGMICLIKIDFLNLGTASYWKWIGIVEEHLLSSVEFQIGHSVSLWCRLCPP